MLRMTIVYEFASVRAWRHIDPGSAVAAGSSAPGQRGDRGGKSQAILDASNRSVSINVSASRITWPRASRSSGALGVDRRALPLGQVQDFYVGVIAPANSEFGRV